MYLHVKLSFLCLCHNLQNTLYIVNTYRKRDSREITRLKKETATKRFFYGETEKQVKKMAEKRQQRERTGKRKHRKSFWLWLDSRFSFVWISATTKELQQTLLNTRMYFVAWIINRATTSLIITRSARCRIEIEVRRRKRRLKFSSWIHETRGKIGYRELTEICDEVAREIN